jgi:hypothetical protein
MVGAIFAATIVGGGGAARTAILPVDAAYSTHSISSARMAERSDNASGGTRSLTGPNGPANAQVNAVGNSNPSPSADNSDGRHGDPKNPTPILALAVSEPATWGMMVLGVCLMAVGLRMMRAKPVKTGASAGERFYTA